MEWNGYYQGLSSEKKKIFRIRTILFRKTTSFQTDLNLELTNEMEILISSAFVQLTFGLKHAVLRIFNDIFITPKPYSYNHIDHTFDGDVNLYTKKVSLTWPVVEQGFNINNDGINLALHEFAHCLILENSRMSYLSRTLAENELDNWKIIGQKKIEKIRSKKNRLLRDYAGNNLMELFAVSIEEFFERPDHFYRKEPSLYFSFCRLLNQDPRKKLNPILSKKDYFNYPFSKNSA